LAHDSGFRIQDSGFRIQTPKPNPECYILPGEDLIQDSGFRIQNAGFRIQDPKFKTHP
jgi:hypothetical protein